MSKSHVINVRVSKAEFEGLSATSQTSGITRSRLVRRLVRELLRGGPDYFDDGLQELRAAHRELASVGRNLNQLLRLSYQSRDEPGQGEDGANPDLDEEAFETVLKETQARVAELKAVFATEVRASRERSLAISKSTA